MELIALGDQSAYAEAVRRHGRSIAAYAYRMIGQQADAEDIAQETFLRLWTHAHRWQADKAAVSTWLHRIAHNLCVDLLRRDKSAINMALDDEHADPALSSEQLISLDADRVSLQLAISTLPERQRSALIMTHYQGLSDKVVADIMDVSVDALPSRQPFFMERLASWMLPQPGHVWTQLWRPAAAACLPLVLGLYIGGQMEIGAGLNATDVYVVSSEEEELYLISLSDYAEVM